MILKSIIIPLLSLIINIIEQQNTNDSIIENAHNKTNGLPIITMLK